MVCEPCALSSKEGLIAEAKSNYHLMTHTPKNSFRPICQKARAKQKQARRLRRAGRKAKARLGKYATAEGKDPKVFGHLVTADPIVLSSEKDKGASEKENVERSPLRTPPRNAWDVCRWPTRLAERGKLLSAISLAGQRSRSSTATMLESSKGPQENSGGCIC